MSKKYYQVVDLATADEVSKSTLQYNNLNHIWKLCKFLFEYTYLGIANVVEMYSSFCYFVKTRLR